MKVVLAYSGGLDTSVIVKWIKDRFNAEVVTFAANVGQGEELSGLAEKAKATGAVAHYTVDLQDEFVADFIYPMIRANAIYEGQYYLAGALKAPSETILHADSTYTADHASDALRPTWSVRVDNNNQTRIKLQHNNRANCSYFDGHVKGSDKNELRNSINVVRAVADSSSVKLPLM